MCVSAKRRVKSVVCVSEVSLTRKNSLLHQLLGDKVRLLSGLSQSEGAQDNGSALDVRRDFLVSLILDHNQDE